MGSGVGLGCLGGGVGWDDGWGFGGDFSELDFVVVEATSPVVDLRGGIRILPSAWCWARTGDETWPLRRCLLDGMPRAEAKLLAMEELASRWGRCAAARLCDAGRYGEPA